jgi:hypothetical protein
MPPNVVSAVGSVGGGDGSSSGADCAQGEPTVAPQVPGSVPGSRCKRGSCKARLASAMNSAMKSSDEMESLDIVDGGPMEMGLSTTSPIINPERMSVSRSVARL